MTVAELQARMSQRELDEWQIFAQVEKEERDQRDLERKAREGLDSMSAKRGRRV